MRRAPSVVCALSLVVVTGCAGDQMTGNDWTIATNAVPNDMTLAVVALVDVTGTRRSTAEFTGRPLVVNFWYASCEPCKREMPVLAAFHEERGGDITVLGVNMGDPSVVASNFVANHQVGFPVLLDDEGVLAAAMRIGLAPTTLVVAPDGTVVHHVAGELTRDELDQAVAHLEVP